MKTTRLLAAGLPLYVCLLTLAAADPPDPAASTYEPGSDPRAYNNSTPRANASSAPAKSEASSDDNWLLRGYEEQLQARALAGGQSQNNNLYVELTSDKNLATASGLASSMPPTPAANTLHTGTDSGIAPVNLRNDASPAPAAPASQTPLGAATGIQLKPLVTPLESSEVAGLRDLFAKLPELSARSAPARSLDVEDPNALDVPGMVAAESDPTRRADMELTLETLPGEALAQELKHHQLSAELPVATDAQLAHDQQNATLLPAGKNKIAPPVPINPRLMKPIDDTALMVPDPSPIRGQVDDPYAILH